MTLSDWMTWKKRPARVVAEAIGVSHVTVNRYVSGERRPEWDVLQRIFAYTEGAVTPNDFLRRPRQRSGEKSQVA